MKKQNYEPAKDDDKVIWLNTFAQNLSNYSVALGLAATDITSAQNDAAYFKYAMNAVDSYIVAKESWVEFKNLIKSGPLGATAGSVPQTPNLGTAPTVVVAPGIMPRIRALISRIKSHPNYTDTIGNALGIVGSDNTVDPSTLKPALNLVLKGGFVEVQWVKSISDGVKIEIDRGDAAGWKFLAVDTHPHYTDTVTPTAAATWKYRAIYLQHDQTIGLQSDVSSIAVG